jgi:hypothetical protein
MPKFKPKLRSAGIGTIVIACLCFWFWRSARSVPSDVQQPFTASGDFFAHPSEDTWRRLVAVGQTQGDDLVAVTAFHISRYNEAALQRDLPNSMTRNGHVKEYVEQQEEIMKWEFGILRPTLPSTEARKLLVVLCTQQFDERLVWTGAEIAYRLSPVGLADMAKLANGENRRIMDFTQDRFRAGNGHIGDW